MESNLRTRLYHLRNAEKHRAHVAVVKALNSGALIKPSLCETCEEHGPLSAHHHRGYGPAHVIDVVFLCGPCHWKADHPNGQTVNIVVPPTAEELATLAASSPRGRPRKPKPEPEPIEPLNAHLVDDTMLDIMNIGKIMARRRWRNPEAKAKQKAALEKYWASIPEGERSARMKAIRGKGKRAE